MAAIRRVLMVSCLCEASTTATAALIADARHLCQASLEEALRGPDPTGLVHAADEVVRARADSSHGGVETHELNLRSVVYFTVLERVGAALGPAFRTLVIPGELVADAEYNPAPVPYPTVRPSGGGACHAYAYQRGGEYLLLLQRSPVRGLTPYWAPLKPTNEQLRGPQDPWLAWVRARRPR